MKTYLNTGMGLIGSGIIVGSIPNLSGTTSETTLKTNYATGLGNIGNKLPIYGKVVGTKMVLKSVKKLQPKKKNKSIF